MCESGLGITEKILAVQLSIQAQENIIGQQINNLGEIWEVIQSMAEHMHRTACRT